MELIEAHASAVVFTSRRCERISGESVLRRKRSTWWSHAIQETYAKFST
jgi:hypothetical protein